MIKFYKPCVDLISNEFSINKFNIKNDEVINNDLKEKFTFKNKILIHKLSFKYNDNDHYVLKNLNLEINKGEIIGISGKSGSGKSTLLNLICSLLKPSSGSILVDDKLINNFQKEYQTKISYVTQKIYLIDDTIIKNIIFGIDSDNYDYKLFNDCIKKANLEDIINRLPLKENTVIGERGMRLSGGQQQRMGIARALYKSSEILILDEATNALDEESEKDILNTIYKLKDRLTIILCSHKKTVLDYCDKIYKIDNGTISQEK